MDQSPAMESYTSASKEKIQETVKSTQQRVPKFLLKTYDLITDGNYSDCICWIEKGTAFAIKDKDFFENNILPQAFSHSKLSSFIRQLNMYDFVKLRHPIYQLAWSHPLFQLNKRNELGNMLRRTNASYPKFQDAFSKLISKDSEKSELSSNSERHSQVLNERIDLCQSVNAMRDDLLRLNELIQHRKMVNRELRTKSQILGSKVNQLQQTIEFFKNSYLFKGNYGQYQQKPFLQYESHEDFIQNNDYLASGKPITTFDYYKGNDFIDYSQTQVELSEDFGAPDMTANLT